MTNVPKLGPNSPSLTHQYRSDNNRIPGRNRYSKRPPESLHNFSTTYDGNTSVCPTLSSSVSARYPWSQTDYQHHRRQNPIKIVWHYVIWLFKGFCAKPNHNQSDRTIPKWPTKCRIAHTTTVATVSSTLKNSNPQMTQNAHNHKCTPQPKGRATSTPGTPLTHLAIDSPPRANRINHPHRTKHHPQPIEQATHDLIKFIITNCAHYRNPYESLLPSQ